MSNKTIEQILGLLNAELEEASENSSNYEEFTPAVLSKEEKAIYVINREVSKEKKNLLKRIIRNVNAILE